MPALDGRGVTEDDIDYEAIARAAERQPPETPDIADQEVKTHGPVLIDTVTGAIRDAETGESLLSAPAIRPTGEREVDLALIVMGAFLLAFAFCLAAVVLAPFSASQKCALAALAIVLAVERVWFEIRRTNQPTAPEGVAYVPSEQADSLGPGYPEP